MVHNYELYPGNRSNNGFEALLKYGVNIAVGINGVGKTTLLNIVIRSLLGPWDPSKAERSEPGQKQSGLTRRKRFSFFSERVDDGAEYATVTADYEFGENKISICRSLKNLRLVWFQIDGALRVESPSEEELFGSLCVLSGVSETIAYDEQKHYEFDFIVRNLVFFLEDKVSLMWQPAGQFVALRILFVDGELSQQLAKARNDLLQVDSAFRNFRWQAGSADERLKDELKKEATPELVRERDMLVEQIKNDEEALQLSLYELDELERQINAAGPELILMRHRVAEAADDVSKLEANHYYSAFYHGKSPADVIIESILAEECCLVCGNEGAHVRERAKALLGKCQCPVCESEIALPEGADGLVEKHLVELEKKERVLEDRRRRFREMEELHGHLTHAHAELVSSCSQLGDQIREKKGKRLQIEGQFPDQEKMKDLRKERDFFEARVKGYKNDLEKTARIHSELVYSAISKIEEIKGRVISAFNHYAGEFLIEDCQLVFDLRKGRVAQEDPQIEWPTFKVQMTSSVDGPLRQRDLGEQVSESQREFVELAFRMALLEVAANEGASMLVVETPEASLDAPFVDRAGKLLREFLNRHPRNTLLASCNLNGERMIPSLLGVDDHELAQTMPRSERLQHVIRLTDVARRPKAYDTYKDHYDRVFEDAIRGVGYPQ